MRLSHAVLGLSCAFGVLGCQKLIGLDGRTLDDDAGTGGVVQPSSACQTYCDDVIDACSGDNDTFVDLPDFGGSHAICLAVCQHFDLHADPESNQNTLACRKARAEQAATLKNVPFEIPAYCPAAGPGGGAPGSVKNCGTNCQGYCSLFQAVCQPDLDRAECERQCSALHDNEVVNAEQDFMTFPDTIQCRLAHLSVASFTDPDTHCGHAALVPDPSDAVSCDLGPDTEPDCGDYCKLVGVACTGDRALYGSRSQCMAVCNALPSGLAKQVTGNSVACRRWRGYASLVDATSCPSAGPIAAQPCGDPCEVYCGLAQTGCTQGFAEHFAGSDAMGTCISQCKALPFSGGYSVAGAKGDTLECRVLQASKALDGNPDACPKALGVTPCE
ncbi:MAG: hypothetical protein QM778_14195 [Myxococcales bacterium]